MQQQSTVFTEAELKYLRKMAVEIEELKTELWKEHEESKKLR
jgi:hypothetical protein